MSEFDKLKDDAEQYAKDHPQQVHEAEQDAEHAAESKIDPGKQGQGSPQDNSGPDTSGPDTSGQQGQRDDSDRNSSQSDQDHDQGQSQSQDR